MKQVSIKRSEAGHLLGHIARILGQHEHEPEHKPEQTLKAIQLLLSAAGIEPAVPCTGDAHSNPHIDNCMVCLPNWGWIVPEVKVR